MIQSVLRGFGIWALVPIVISIVGSPMMASEQERLRRNGEGKASTFPNTTRGPKNAPVSIIIFADFVSFHCGRSERVITEFTKKEPGIHVLFKHDPSPTNEVALLAHEAALAAGAQGKFWEMHDLLFENQRMLARGDLLRYARQLELDVKLFQQALDDHTYRPFIERDRRFRLFSGFRC